MQIPKAKHEQVRTILGKLKDRTLSGTLYRAIAGWLVSGDSPEEKERQMSELFDDTFAYTRHPSREAHRSFDQFARRNGMARTALPPRLRRRIALRVAAVLIPALAAGGTLWLVSRTTGPAGPGQPIVLVTGSGPAGQQTAASDDTAVTLVENATHTLPDRSTVRLGPGSRLSYSETPGGGRHVDLQGEAHFNVARSQAPDAYFTVHTDHFDIRVLGTEFDVRAPLDNAHSTVDLLHGSIEIVAGDRTIRMKPGDHLDFQHATRATAMSTIALGNRIYDRMPGLVFRKTPLMEVLRLVERDYGVPCIVEGSVPEEQTLVDGNLTDVRSLDELMGMLQKLSGRFDYRIGDDKIHITISDIQ